MQVIKGDIKRRMVAPIVHAFADHPKPSPSSTPSSSSAAVPSSSPIHDGDVDGDYQLRVQQYFQQHPDATIIQCATDLNINRGTVSKYRKKEFT